jgi:DNA-binding GntR family transcriptional regulator
MTSPLERVSTVEALTIALRREVLGGTWPPGSQLREIELSARFGVARQSVRSALQELVHAGLLRHEPNRGAFVPRFTPEDVADIYALRLAIESEAVAHPADGERVRAALERLERLADDADWATAVDADLALHEAIVAGLGSPRTLRAFRGLLGEQRLLLAQVEAAYPRRMVLAPLHREIVEAVLAGEAERARRALRTHLVESRDEVVRALGG